MELAGKLELHYYLANESHAMSAVVRNRCEAEALAIFQEVARIMDVRIVVESVAHREGGLIEIWSMMAQSKDQLALISAVVMPLIVVALSRPQKTDPELNMLTKEATRLSIEESKLSIEKMKLELQSTGITSTTAETISNIINCNQKVAFRKSNFYKILGSYKRVTGIGLTPLNQNHVPIRQQEFVARQDFGKFVIPTDTLPVQVIEDAKVEIVSPVLKEGDYQWKGVYEGVTISFSMLDGDFKNQVLREEVSFKHGTVIECVLNISRKYNEVGDIIPTHYSVSTVIEKSDSAESLTTLQGKRYRAGKKFREDQMGLGF